MPVKHAEHSVEELLRNLESDDDDLRRHASQDLGDLGDAAAIPGLIRALEDPVIAVREAAAEALGAIGGREVGRQVAPLMSSENAALRNVGLEILEALGTEAVEELVRCCSSPSSDIRKFAIDILGKIGEVSEIRVTELLAMMLNDANINVAGAAAEALGRVGDGAALPALVSRLDSESWLQCNIMNALASIGGEAAAEALGKVDVEQLSPEALRYYRLAVDMLARK